MGKAYVFGIVTAQKVFDLQMQIDLHTVADINDKAGARPAHEFGFSMPHPTGARCWPTPKIDVFDITAPNALHKEMALQANTSIAKSRCPPGRRRR